MYHTQKGGEEEGRKGRRRRGGCLRGLRNSLLIADSSMGYLTDTILLCPTKSLAETEQPHYRSSSDVMSSK